MVKVLLFVVELDVVAEESARLGSARVRKLVRVGWKGVEKLGRGRLGPLGSAPWLSLLGNASQDSLPWGLPRNPARRPRRGEGARYNPSNDQVTTKKAVEGFGKRPSEEAPGPRKKAKLIGRHKSHREGEGSKTRAPKGKGPTSPIDEASAP
ncbi:hypothetical protein BHM03_00012641 [Ensete ventricosum]|nr:hypothetical protein BHM03_00012641 [Ensete ventricosum]